MSPTRSLKDTVIAITGAASGIGRASVLAALTHSAKVVAQDVDSAGLDGLVEFTQSDDLVTLGGDIADPQTAEAMVELADDRWGRLDSVVLCAGIGLFGGLLDHSAADLQRMVNVNVGGTIWSIQSALRQFRRQVANGVTGGDIVVVASVAGMGIGGGNEAVYSATKGAQLNLAAALDKEIRSEGVRVSVVAPAAVNTHFAASTGRFGESAPEDGPYLHPEEVAQAIVTVLRQPRRMRTAEWTMWSLAEPRG